MIPYSFGNLHLWLPGYIQNRLERRRAGPAQTVWMTIADHYEPYWGKADRATAIERVNRWRKAWPRVASRHRDSAGKSPCYTFFYAQEEYDADAVAYITELAEAGIADVEVHLHHDGEGEADFVTRLRSFVELLHLRHGLLRRRDDKLVFGFIHGNWALDNSRPDGRWCGLNHEITLLKQLGCYADFTLPSAPSGTQTAIVNTIYWAKDDPEKPKSHHRGKPLKPGGAVEGDLLLIPGPLGWNYRGSRRLIPRLETGELAAYDPPVQGRARSWLDLAPQVGNHIFLKLHTHGTQEANASMLLEGGLDRCFEDLSAECERRGYALRFVSAWEMWQVLDAVRERRC